MRAVSIPGSESRTSALGFGCSALVGGKTTKEALRLLEVAYDAGVRHFDVARVYGTGDAESLLGRFAAGRRDEITIASKFGIDPPPRRAGVDVAKRFARVAMRASPRLLRFARRHSGAVMQRGEFTPEQARQSLETSLAELATSYLDVYLLHGCTVADWHRETLLDALDELAEGERVRSFGTATGVGETEAIFTQPGRNPAVAQFDRDLLQPLARVGVDGRALPITHGSFRQALGELQELFGRDPAAAAEWSRALEADVTAPGEVAGLLLCEALAANRNGIVLFSSSSEERIQRNARLADEMPYEPGQLDEFAQRARAALSR